MRHAVPSERIEDDVMLMRSCLYIAALWSPAGKRASLLALLYVMFSCAFVTFPCGVLGQMRYLCRFLIFAFFLTNVFCLI